MLKQFIFALILICLHGIMVSAGFSQPALSPASINNMIDDGVSRTVESLTNVDTRVKTIAIWSIESSAGSPIDAALVEKKLTLALVRAKNFSRFTVVDSAMLKIRIANQNLQYSKVIDRSKMMKIGEALKIQAFLYGSATLGDEEVILTLNLVDTSSGAVIWWDEINGHDPVLVALRKQEAEAAKRALERDQAMKKMKSRMDATLRSLLLPGLGQLYTDNHSRGITYFFIEGIAGIILLQAVINQSDEDDGNSNDVQRSIGIALIGANHWVSAVDAGLSAHRYNAQLKARYNLSMKLDSTEQQMLLTYKYHF